MELNQIVQIAKNKKNIYIIGHDNPDGDCIGATLSLAMLLEKCNIATKVLLKDIPEVYSFLPIDKWVVDKPVDNIDLLIALDCSDMSRLGNFSEYILKANTIINIDHHVSNTMYGDFNEVNTVASSTSEIIYELVNDYSLLDKDIATCIYTGIIYDTGVFKHSSTTKRTHEIAGKLIEFDFDFTEIINNLFYKNTLTSLKSKERAISHLNIVEQGQIAISYLTIEDIKDIKAKKSDTEGIINLILQLDEVHVSAFLYEVESNKFKVSLRSKGNVDVCKVAMAFQGGGHVKASGCLIEGQLKDNITKIINKIKEQL